MYVLVRKDLPGTQPAVQAGHALAQYLLEHPDMVGFEGKDIWVNGTLIYLGIPNKSDLIDWVVKMQEREDISYSEFFEPDIGDELTAVAALDYPDGRLEKLFKNLDLL